MGISSCFQLFQRGFEAQPLGAQPASPPSHSGRRCPPPRWNPPRSPLGTPGVATVFQGKEGEEGWNPKRLEVKSLNEKIMRSGQTCPNIGAVGVQTLDIERKGQQAVAAWPRRAPRVVFFGGTVCLSMLLLGMLRSYISHQVDGHPKHDCKPKQPWFSPPQARLIFLS